MERKNLKVGLEIEFIKNCDGHEIKGQTGKIINLKPTNVGIQIYGSFCGHNLDGEIDDTNGWNFDMETILNGTKLKFTTWKERYQ